MIPAGLHNDWSWPFSKIPRRWTAFEGKPPRKLLGNSPATKPIPDRGHWLVAWPPYLALQTQNGWHFRIGVRWDDVDSYYQVPSFTIKRFIDV